MQSLEGFFVLSPYWSDHWGDAASAAGLMLAILGFAATLWKLSQAKSASVAAKDAMEGLRREFDLFDLASELARAKAIMEEVKRLQRASAWHIIPDRYQFLRECLVSVRDSGKVLSNEHRAILTGIVQQFQKMEQQVEKSNNTKAASPSVARLNTIVSEQHEALTVLVAALRSNLGTHQT